MTLVSVIIVNWNAKAYLKKCIESLLSQTFTDYEIILVDNASSDDSVSIVKNNYPQVKIIENKSNVGFAEANNIGIHNSNGKILAFFNPDAIADKNWLSILVHTVQSSDKIAAATGKMFYLDDQVENNKVFCTWSKINPYSAVPYNFHNDESKSKVDYLSGAAMIVKRIALEKIGLFDPDYFLYFEETDLCARMIRFGYDLMYVPEALVWHAVSPLSDSMSKIYYMERNRMRFAIKNFDFINVITFSFIFFAETLVISIRDIKNRNFSRTKIRLNAIMWNMSRLKNTILARKKYFSTLEKNGTIHSYNKNLPLRSFNVKSD